MVSIPHIEDLGFEDLLKVFNHDWWISRKEDGSFFEFGLDKDGRFYTARKNAPPCFTVDDWPDECWSSTFRIAHSVAEGLVNLLIEQNLIETNTYFRAEILDHEHGNSGGIAMPNAVPYLLPPLASAVLLITGTSHQPSDEVHRILTSYKASEARSVRTTLDGRDTTILNLAPQTWAVDICYRRWISETSMNKRIRLVLEEWSSQQNTVLPALTNFEFMTCPLNRKHPKITDRSWTEVRDLIKRGRADYRENLNALIVHAKKDILRLGDVSDSSLKIASVINEGFVVNVSDSMGWSLMFKIVDREVFPKINLHVHRVKYWLAGGRRPARPSFLSRTKDWPIDKRLERLDVLLDRYQRLRHKLEIADNLTISKNTAYWKYQGQLHQRTLGLFADIRKRIIDGR